MIKVLICPLDLGLTGSGETGGVRVKGETQETGCRGAD